MELVTTKICMAFDLGVHGNYFGGNMMSLLDESAAAYACQICDSDKMVTVKIEEVVFQSPVKVGNLIKIYASVDKFGTTSITINLEARKHNVHTGKQELVCQYIGYQVYTKSIIVTAESATQLNIVMQEQQYQMKEVVIMKSK